MNLASIVDRIDLETSVFKVVAGAAKFEQATKTLPAIPAAYVLPGAESAEANPFANQLVEQRILVEFVVVVAVRNLVDAKGASAFDELAPVRDPLFDALLNWTPDGATDGCEFKRGELMLIDNGVLWWGDTFTTYYMRRSV